MAKAEIPTEVLRSTRYDPVCVKTGRAHERWIKADFYHVPPWVYLLVLAGVIPLIVVMLVVRKQVSIHLPAVNEVQRNRRLMTAAVVVALIAGVIMLFAGAVAWEWAAAGGLLILASIFLGIWGTERVWLRGTLSPDQMTVKLRGAHPDFIERATTLAHPPPVPAPPVPPPPAASMTADKPGLQNLSYVREGRAVATVPVPEQAYPGPMPVGGPPTPPPTAYESGRGPGSAVPPELGGWNWGGFLLTWIWGIGNRVWVALLALIPLPLLAIAMAVVLGVKGNEWAWQKKRWRDVEHFKQVQKKWTIAGVIVWGLILAGVVTAIVATRPWETPEVTDGSFAPDSQGTEIVADDDGEFTLTVPTSWFPDDRLNKRADLGVGHPFEEMYAIVFMEDAQGIPRNVGLERYSGITRGPILDGIASGSEKKVGTRIIDGYDALEYELRGTVDGLDLVYLHTVLRTETHFVQILTWTLESRFDRNSETLRAVVNSFDAR